jgi:SAM-dependent methyltransferase
VVSAFEDWPLPEETFDTRAVRGGLHWLDPDTRMTKAADALRPDGSLAVISTPHIAGVTEDFFVNVQRRYERFDRHVPPGLRLPTSAEISTGADEFDQSLRFGPAEFRPYEWEQNALNTLIAWSLSSALRVSASVASRLGVPTSEGRQEHSN